LLERFFKCCLTQSSQAVGIRAVNGNDRHHLLLLCMVLLSPRIDRV
jgi:hypothetical protein